MEAKVCKEIMKKEWNMSKCTPLSLERLVQIGVHPTLLVVPA
jgi:hypothetical protein